MVLDLRSAPKNLGTTIWGRDIYDRDMKMGRTIEFDIREATSVGQLMTRCPK